MRRRRTIETTTLRRGLVGVLCLLLAGCGIQLAPAAQQPIKAPVVAEAPVPAPVGESPVADAPVPAPKVATTFNEAAFGAWVKHWAAWPRLPRVGLQVGHLNSRELPDELARLRNNTGATGGGWTEAQLNLDVAARVKQRLEYAGVTVDLLPATVPVRYQSDAFIAIHADGNPDPSVRGWKLATYWRAAPASRSLARALALSYSTLDMPYDPTITANMRGYYAFNNENFAHSIATTTPAVILELGYLSSPADRELMLGAPDRLADAISLGILRHLAKYDPNDPQLVTPPTMLPEVKPIAVVNVRRQPSEQAPVMRSVPPWLRLYPFRLRDGGYEVPPTYRWTGWVRADLVRPVEPLDYVEAR